MNRCDTLIRLKAMKKCLECEVKGLKHDCDDCITMYEAGTVGEGIQMFSELITMMEEIPMRDLIALRAKIDLKINDIKNSESPSYMDEYHTGQVIALAWVNDMIDKMVGKQLEDMYAEHIQEANGQTD